MMPLHVLIPFIIITVLIWFFVLLIIQYAEKREKLVVIAILSVITAAVGAGIVWYYSSTAAGKRAWKSQESNFGNGIHRKVEVYSMDGKLLKEYEGKFDIEYDDDRILFDDENGYRHVIYYPTGTVIVDEVAE